MALAARIKPDRRTTRLKRAANSSGPGSNSQASCQDSGWKQFHEHPGKGVLRLNYPPSTMNI